MGCSAVKKTERTGHRWSATRNLDSFSAIVSILTARRPPPALISRLVRVAAFQNPEFYAAQAMRLPTFGKPRIISCAEFPKHVALAREGVAIDISQASLASSVLR